MNIGQRIKNTRVKKNISQAQLAEIIGSTQPALAAYENNRIIPKIETLQRIAAALDVSFMSLLPSSITGDSITPTNETEKEIYDLLSGMNHAGQVKVRDYAADISGNPKYRN